MLLGLVHCLAISHFSYVKVQSMDDCIGQPASFVTVHVLSRGVKSE